MNRTYLQTFHKRLENYLDDWLGFTPSVINGATKCGNKSISQIKTETAQGEYVKKVWMYMNAKKQDFRILG
ncbi:MAG: hypothetical protein IJA85_04705 [Clostridia bacterium]|nr:hypothetical protein [Clostridia bacterium]